MSPTVTDRLANLERRLEDLEKRTHPVTPGEHDLGQLIDHLRGGRARVRAYLDAPPDTSGDLASDEDAHRELDSLEQTFRQATERST